MTVEPVGGCAGCDRGWRHCHHTWVAHHDDGECSGDSPCPEPAEAHELVVVCTDVDVSCSCD